MDVVSIKTTGKIIPYVKLIEQNKLNAPISLHLLITDWCVNKCNMCDHWKTHNKKLLSMETLKKIWKEMNDNNGESICLTGGDPVIHPDFNEILEMKRSFDLGIITTGNFQEDFKWDLLSSLKWTRFSIDSLDTDRYKTIRGRNNLYTEIIPNLHRALELNREVGINFTIQKLNHDEILNVIKFANENKIYRLMLYPMHGDYELAMGREEIKSVIAHLRIAQTFAYDEMIPENNINSLLEDLIKIYKKDGTDVRETVDLDTHPCMINKIHLAIGTDGKVYPCETSLDDTDIQVDRKISIKYIEVGGEHFEVEENHINSIGDVNKESLIKIWKKNYHNSFITDKCQNCYSRYRPIIDAYYDNLNRKTFI